MTLEVFCSIKYKSGSVSLKHLLHFTGIPGVDIAYVDKGYVYHTEFDSMEQVIGCTNNNSYVGVDPFSTSVDPNLTSLREGFYAGE